MKPHLSSKPDNLPSLSEPSIGYRPFSDFETSPARRESFSPEQSDFSWSDAAIAVDPESPTANRSTGLLATRSLEGEGLVHPPLLRTALDRSGIETMARTKKASKARVAPARSTQSRTMGTGPHDNNLALSQGDFREPSLRRGSGMVVETPAGIRKVIEKNKKKGTWYNTSAQSSTASSTQGALNDTNLPQREPLPSGSDVCPYRYHHLCTLLTRPKWFQTLPKPQRGDVPPLTIRQPIAVRQPTDIRPWALEKAAVLRTCLQFQDEYIKIPLGTRLDGPFWTRV
ncbi:hypothetical protein B0T10DRAFT_479329 [Thelonectria olida]|uniref:Uncharacterized protein n=1 Tax=Thelonectria olida TaxID=1576542 RepID=A0A9P8WDD3_9HYPO|nr:hypothetical protein B0T10DRAFT_479329 [Thelonectria olida]